MNSREVITMGATPCDPLFLSRALPPSFILTSLFLRPIPSSTLPHPSSFFFFSPKNPLHLSNFHVLTNSGIHNRHQQKISLIDPSITRTREAIKRKVFFIFIFIFIMDSASGAGGSDPRIAAGPSSGAGGLSGGSGEGPSSSAAPPSRYESQKRRDWNTFLQYLKNHKPPLTLGRCSGAHVIEFLKYLDQFGKTKVHITGCPYFGHPNPPAPCACPLRQAWGSLDALIGRLRAAYEENGGRPESNPFGARAVRIYLREVREAQAKARGIPYEKKKRKRHVVPATTMVTASANASAGGGGDAAVPVITSSTVAPTNSNAASTV